MGTCFTKTQHVSGRQQKSEHPSTKQASQNPSRKQKPHLDPHSYSTSKDSNASQNIRHIHGNNSFQSFHNRRVCGNQKTYGASSEINRTFDINTGK